MVKVMIVEDEPPIANSLKKIVESKSENFQVVHMATNGKRAIEYLKENEIDLVFTDIKMPLVDGLELANYIHKHCEETSVIILSGFQDFKYAQKALKCKVMDYVLKPISKNEILSLLDEFYANYMEQHQSIQRYLLENTELESSFETKELYAVVFFCIGNVPLQQDSIDSRAKNSFTNEKVETVLSFLKSSRNCMCINGKNINEKIILFRSESMEEIEQLTDELFNKLQCQSEKHLSLMVYNQLIDLNHVKSVSWKLRKELKSRSRLFTSKKFFYQRKIGTSKKFDYSVDSELIKALTSRNKKNIYETILFLIKEAVSSEMKQKNFVMFIEKNIIHFYDSFLEINQLSELFQQLEISLTTSEDEKSLAKELSDVLYFWLNPELQVVATHELMEEVTDYIKQNYRNNISLNFLAKQFGISGVNLSKKFKKYHNMSISEYVNNYRIELAIGLMNYDKNKMIKEISGEVGYNDQYYFSKTFKKVTGVWPTEYMRDKREA